MFNILMFNIPHAPRFINKHRIINIQEEERYFLRDIPHKSRSHYRFIAKLALSIYYSRDGACAGSPPLSLSLAERVKKKFVSTRSITPLASILQFHPAVTANTIDLIKPLREIISISLLGLPRGKNE